MLQYLNDVAVGDVRSNQTVTVKSDATNDSSHLTWRNTPLTYPLSSPGSQMPISPMSNQQSPASIPPDTPSGMISRAYTPSQMVCQPQNNSNLPWNERGQKTNQMVHQQQPPQHPDQQLSMQTNMAANYSQHHQPLPNYPNHYSTRHILPNNQQQMQQQHAENSYNNPYMMNNCQPPMNYYMPMQQQSQQQQCHPQMVRYDHGMMSSRPNFIQCMRVQGHCYRNDQSACNSCKLSQPMIAMSGNNVEIQFGDVSQSQLSPAVAHQRQQQQSQTMNTNVQQNVSSAIQPQQQQQQQQQQHHNGDHCVHNDNCMHHSGMRQDTYQRTLEYVQNCQSWTENSETVSSSSHPSSNMIINSLLEENRFFQMIQ